jgi:flavodoxin
LILLKERRISMKTALVYFSRTGHSKRIAKAIAEALQIAALDVKSEPVLNEVDLLFIVGGIYGGASSPELKAYAEGLSKSSVKKAALITSCLNRIHRQSMIREILTRKGIDVAPDEFVCKGSFLFFGLGHPSKEEIDAAISFARKAIAENT